VAIAQGMGMAAERVETAEAFDDAFARAMATPGPRLIEAAMG
jgi:acetolactate synthase-1/2/3 large subunit